MKRKRHFTKEIKTLMYGFGDDATLPESVDVMDELLEWFLVDLCDRATKLSKGPRIKAPDLLTALANDPKKLARATELITLDKELRQARATFDVTAMIGESSQSAKKAGEDDE